MTTRRGVGLLLGGLLVVTSGLGSVAVATIPYTPVAGPFPGFGPGVIAPALVGGKEYTHDLDHEVVLGAVGPPNVLADPEQLVAWDGTPGASGVVNVADYTGTRTLYDDDDEIDAIANRGDFAYGELKEDIAHLVFSVDDFYTIYSFGAPGPAFLPAAGPVPISNGNVIGGAGEYSVEESGFFTGAPPEVQSLWAAQLDVNGMPPPVGPDDLDGVELWGPEPFGDPLMGDANKYSLDVDFGSIGVFGGDAVAVWNASGTPYVGHASIVGAVIALLGDLPDGIDRDAINLDALMVQDRFGDPDRFEDGIAGPGDEIIFSIRQIPDPSDPTGYYATGSELFVLNASAPPMFLAHGGHLWDKAYAAAAFDVWFMDPNNYGVIDINAIEAIGEFAVPEPASLALLLIGLSGIGFIARQR